jgi:hypothetical protein
VGHVDTEAVDSSVGPEAQGGAEVGPDLLVVPVEVGLFGREEVQVPLPVRDLLPRAAAEDRRPVGGREFAVLAAAVAEHIAAAGGGTGGGGQRFLEPTVQPRSVVGHDVDHDLQAQPVRLGDHRVEVVERAQARVHVPVVGDVVAAVGEFRGVERAEPEGVDAQCGQVAEALGDALEVPEPVTVGVGETAWIDLIDDGLPPPVRVTGGQVCGTLGHTDSLWITAGNSRRRETNSLCPAAS